MSHIEPTPSFDPGEINLLAKALTLLLNERSRAYELAAEIAAAKGESMPSHEDFDLTTILRLSRRCAAYVAVQGGRKHAPQPVTRKFGT
ncbi:hypothetical protein GCM10027093_70770 [Paraburkholderia jirisanensis]